MSDLPEKDNNLNENTENIDREEDGASTVFSDPADHKKTAKRIHLCALLVHAAQISSSSFE